MTSEPTTPAYKDENGESGAAPMPLSRDTLISRARTLFESDADGEIVALCPDTSNCFGFNDSASELWRLLKAPQTLDSLVRHLTVRFAVDEEACARDVSSALLWLEDEGLVTLDRAAA